MDPIQSRAAAVVRQYEQDTGDKANLVGLTMELPKGPFQDWVGANQGLLERLRVWVTVELPPDSGDATEGTVEPRGSLITFLGEPPVSNQRISVVAKPKTGGRRK